MFFILATQFNKKKKILKMTFENVSTIRDLKNLFNQCGINEGDSSDSENDGDVTDAAAYLSPASIKPRKSEIKTTLENPLLKKIEDNSTLKSMDDLEQQQAQDEELLDIRKQPEYKITYKQAVTTEDIYLQMGLKTPATSSCEEMVIDIQLSEETVTIDQMDLNVEADAVYLQTPVYRLKLLLPHKIHPKQGRATFDSEKKVLKLTLRLNRELDFVNF